MLSLGPPARRTGCHHHYTIHRKTGVVPNLGKTHLQCPQGPSAAWHRRAWGEAWRGDKPALQRGFVLTSSSEPMRTNGCRISAASFLAQFSIARSTSCAPCCPMLWRGRRHVAPSRPQHHVRNLFTWGVWLVARGAACARNVLGRLGFQVAAAAGKHFDAWGWNERSGTSAPLAFVQPFRHAWCGGHGTLGCWGVPTRIMLRRARVQAFWRGGFGLARA